MCGLPLLLEFSSLCWGESLAKRRDSLTERELDDDLLRVP